MVVITFHDKLSHRIGRLLEGAFADAVLLIEGTEIPVHRNILAMQSEYFSNLFSSNVGTVETTDETASGSQAIDERAKHQSLVEINDVSLNLARNVFQLRNTSVVAVRAVLDYFYRGEYNFHENVDTHWLALKLALQFKLEDLEDIIINNLVKSVTVDNFVDFYNMKMCYENDQLEDSCISFLIENGEEIAKNDNFSNLNYDSLLSLLNSENFTAEEIEIFHAAERWVCVNKPNKKTKKEIVKKIRLATMSQKDLFDFVSTSKELPSIDILEPIRSITNQDEASTNFRQQRIADLNVAQSSLGAEVTSGSVTGSDLISGSSGCTSHEVGGDPDCIVVKLGKIYRLNELQILLDSNGGSKYKYHVEVSVDGKEWERVVDYSNYWCRSHQFLIFGPKAVRFIRITGTDKDLKLKYLKAMYSKEDYSFVQGIAVASTNVVSASRGATVTGISGNYTAGGAYKPMDCIDGKELSSACMLHNSPLTITLGQPHWLSSLRLRIDEHGNSYTIESSPDGESWQQVCTEARGKVGIIWRTFEFSRRIVLHLRITMKHINPNWSSVRLYHIESPASNIAVTN